MKVSSFVLFPIYRKLTRRGLLASVSFASRGLCHQAARASSGGEAWRRRGSATGALWTTAPRLYPRVSAEARDAEQLAEGYRREVQRLVRELAKKQQRIT